MERQGSFKLLRNLLGSIAGGLSSLASLPFAKRKTPEPSLVEAAPPPPPPPFPGFGPNGDNLSKLYPDMELSESRKRVRLSLDGELEEKGECSNEKKKTYGVAGFGKLSREGSGETSDGFATPVVLKWESYNDIDTAIDDCDAAALGSGVLQGGGMTLRTEFHSDDVAHDASPGGKGIFYTDVVSHGGHDTLHILDGSDEKVVTEHDEMLRDSGDDSDDNLDSFKRTLLARKMKQKKRVQDSMKEEELPRKRVRFGNTALDLSRDAQSSLFASEHGTSMLLKKCASSAKRKWVDEAEDKNEKKLRALTLSEEPVCAEGKTSKVQMIGVSTRKRDRVDDENVHMGSASELRKVVLVENLPLNASGKAISKEFSQFGAIESMRLRAVFFHDEKRRKKQTVSGEINKRPNSQNCWIVYKDEPSAKTALAHNMKEFNGNILHVMAAGAADASKKMASSDRDDSWSVVVQNMPVDVKDEELFQLFGSGGSLKLDVTAVRVTRDPNTGLSKGTAQVFFKKEADVIFLFSLRRTLKLRDRVLLISRACDKTQMEQRLMPPRLAKRSIHLERDEIMTHEKRVKLSSPHEAIEHQVHTRSERSSLEGPKEHIGVHISSSSHVYTTRHVAASTAQSKNLEDSPEAKRKRVEKRQRGISRSKKIRRS